MCSLFFVHRFSRSCGGKNAWKSITVWVQKERRNLNLLRAAGLLAPRPLILHKNLLLMELIGTGAQAAPLLKVCSMIILNLFAKCVAPSLFACSKTEI